MAIPPADERLIATAQRLTSSLADLDTRSAIEEVLRRLRELVDVDESAVLLLDAGAHQLVAYAADGLERDGRQGVRVAVGQGFVGRVAAERRPVVIDDVRPGQIVDPLLRRAGLRTLLGVPLIATGQLVGVLHVGTQRRRTFTDDDVAVVSWAADRVAITLAADQAVAERHAARVMQRGLLPTQMPAVDGLQIATRFVAAEAFGVGGDWYDAFHLPDGSLGFVIGDVAGHGLQAAVVMSRMRSVARAYALEHASPATVLHLVDAKFRHFEADEMATLLYARLDADLATMTIANAGHLPPAFLVPGQEPALLELAADPPICMGRGAAHRDTVVEFPRGAVLAMYTDGLVERRRQPIDERLDVLRRTLTPRPAEQIAGDIMDALIGEDPAEDDTALLVVTRV